MDSLNHVVINAALAFLVTELTRFGENFDWDKFQSGFDKRVRDLVPGSLVDDAAVAVAHAVVAGLRHALANGTEKQTRGLLMAIDGGELAAAHAEARGLLNAAWSPWPATPAQRIVAEAVAPPAVARVRGPFKTPAPVAPDAPAPAEEQPYGDTTV